MSIPTFDGLRVLSLESRRAKEMATLIATFGGAPHVAPSMREVPLESNSAALAFADALDRGDVDVVVLLTGVGTRLLLDIVDHAGGGRRRLVEALGRVRVAARGPKPAGVLRDIGVTPWVLAPEPNTWRELLAAMDEAVGSRGLAGLRVAVQEYGAPNPDLVEGLASRGAVVTAVPVYQWALPEDLAPLEGACRSLATGQVDVTLFTAATQAAHLFQVADRLQLGPDVRAGLRRSVVASIGPTTSEELRARGVAVDVEPSHPKMGVLVREAAERAGALLAARPS